MAARTEPLHKIFDDSQEAPATGRDQGLFAAVERLGREVGFTARMPPAGGSGELSAQAIAAASAARCRPVRLRARWWRQDYGPLLTWMGEDRKPVALIPRIGGGYTLYDPQAGSTRRLTHTQAAQIAPDAVCFYANLPDTKLALGQVLRFGMDRCWRDWGVLALAGCGSALLALVLPFALSMLFSDVLPDGDRGQLLQIGMALVVAALGAFVLDCVSGLANARISGRNATQLTGALWDRLLRLPPSDVQRLGAGDMAVRLSTGTSLQESLTHISVDLLTRGQHLVVSLAALFVTIPMMGLLALFIVALLALATWLTTLAQSRAVMHGAPIQGNVYNQPVEYVSAVAKLRAAGAETRAYERWADNFSELRRRSFKAGKVGNGFRAFCAAFEVLALAAVFWVIARPGGLLASHGLGTGMVLIGAFATFMGSLLGVAQSLSTVGMLLARARRLNVLMASVPVSAPAALDPGTLSGQIEIDNVSVRYQRSDKPALARVSLRAEAGEFIAIVGPSGGGKTTLLRVLLGLLKPEQGSVQFDGRDLASLRLDAVRRQIGTVMQRGRLAPGTLRENIAGAHEVGDDAIWAAAHCAAIDDDIRAMPMQLHTMVLDGAATFSGGQVQRVMIARSLVAKPPIVVFDEATSALDARTQALVVTRTGALQCTRIVIAHRFSTVRLADRVYVMEGGRITQSGSVNELLDQGGYLAEMAQREGYARTTAPVQTTQPAAPSSAMNSPRPVESDGSGVAGRSERSTALPVSMDT